MRGEIEPRYVSAATDLASRLQAPDAGVDPDGRFFSRRRVFCFDNTWRLALGTLSADSVRFERSRTLPRFGKPRVRQRASSLSYDMFRPQLNS